MAVFNGQTITDKGRELLARALAGEGEFQFTGAAFGDQKHTGDIAIIEDLKNKKLDLLVMDTVNDRGTVKVTIQITNETVAESFYTEEFGVYAKLKGDTNEILYSYAIASKPDAIPNNKLGTTFESIHEIFMDISSNTEATIDVNESIVFLTLDIANKNYTQTGLIARGVLEGRTSLEANKQYQDSGGNWHKNIGGDRVWDGSPDTDGQFAQLTWDELYEGKEPKFNKNTGFNLNISHVINSTSKILVASAYAVKLAYDKALEAIGFTNTNKNAIQNNTEQIENLLSKRWFKDNDYYTAHEDALVYPGEYQIDGTKTTLRAGFCGSQCFVTVRNTNPTIPEDGFINQVAYSYNAGTPNLVASRTRSGISSGKTWSPWKYSS